MSAHWTENSRALKILIGVMTTLLVLGLIGLVVGIAKTSKEMSEQFADVAVAVPAGARMTALTAADGRLYLALEHGDGRQSILVLDAANGKALGEMALAPAP